MSCGVPVTRPSASPFCLLSCSTRWPRCRWPSLQCGFGLRLLSGSVHLSAALAVLVIAPEVFLPLRRASAEFHESAEGLAAAARAMTLIDPDRASTGAARSVGSRAFRIRTVPDIASVGPRQLQVGMHPFSTART